MKNDIFDSRVQNRAGYKLYETVELLQYNDILLEGTSYIGASVQRAVTLAIMALLDDATGETSGLVTFLPILYKNIYELHQSNKLIDAELSSTSADVEELERLRVDLSRDVIDVLNAFIIALPIPIVDTVAVPIVNYLEDSIVSGAASKVTDLFNSLSQTSPMLGKIIKIVTYPLGAPVFLKALSNIDKLSEEKIQLTMKGMEMVPDNEDVGPIIDITPEDELETSTSSSNLVSESLSLKRWQLLAGV